MSSLGPTYDLKKLQSLVGAKWYKSTGSSRDGAFELGMDETDIVNCVLALTDSDFHKTMESEKRRGLFQDVYLPTYCGIQIYLKLQLQRDRTSGEYAVVISFKRK